MTEDTVISVRRAQEATAYRRLGLCIAAVVFAAEAIISGVFLGLNAGGGAAMSGLLGGMAGGYGAAGAYMAARCMVG